MVKLATLNTLAKLENEMTRAGRSTEAEALREAGRALTRMERELITTGQAAARLGVSIPTIKRWAERDVLAAALIGGRWRVSAESVERLVRLRSSLAELDREGNPSPEEIQDLYDSA